MELNYTTKTKSINDNEVKILADNKAEVKTGRYKFIISKTLHDDHEAKLASIISESTEMLAQYLYAAVERSPDKLAPATQIIADCMTMLILCRNLLELPQKVLDSIKEKDITKIENAILAANETSITILSAFEYASGPEPNNEVAH